jgi:flagellar motor component MotA
MIATLLKWTGLNQVGLYATIVAAVLLLGLAGYSTVLGYQLELRKQEYVALNKDYKDALDKNKELVAQMDLVRKGAALDEKVVAENQKEMERLQDEHDKRTKEIQEKGSSGPAGGAVICAITGVC